MSNRNRDAARWLRADLGDVVQVVPHEAREHAREGARVGLTDGLRRWSARLARQRSLAVVRRQLLLGGTLAAVAALAILIAGDARPWWLAAAGIAFALVCGAVAWLRRPSLSASAQILDRELAMHDRLGTALELEAGGASGGLAGVVRSEAAVAIGASLRQARAGLAPAGREWAWLAAVVCALAVLIAVPRGGSATSQNPRLTPGQIIPGKGTVSGTATGGKALRTSTSVAQATTPQETASVPLAPPGHGGAADPYVNHGKQYTNPDAPPTVPKGDLAKPPKLNLASIGSRSPASGGGSGSDSGGGKSGSASHPSANQGGSKLANPTGGSGGGGNSGLQPAASGGKGGNTPGASHSGGASQGSQHGSSAAPAGGESAGSTRAPALGQSSGITSALGKDNSSLPLQGGFRPVGGKGTAAKGGQQIQQGGGGGASRTATVGSGGSGGGSGNFAALAPTFNSPSSNSSITSYYFGTANQLSFKGW